jgi:hypothetical protein
MPGRRAPSVPYQLSRTSRWLSRWLKLLPLKADELAKLLATDPTDRDKWPRASVRRYLSGSRLPDAQTTLVIGELFGRLRDPLQPYCDGVVALHAAGRFESVIPLLATMLEREKWRNYARAAIAGLWPSNAFLDFAVADAGHITVQERTLAAEAARIPNFSDDLRALWKESAVSAKPGLFAAALAFTVKAQQPTYRAALIAWRALNEIAVQQSFEGATDDRFPGFFESYLDIAHQAMTLPTDATPERKERDVS